MFVAIPFSGQVGDGVTVGLLIDVGKGCEVIVTVAVAAGKTVEIFVFVCISVGVTTILCCSLPPYSCAESHAETSIRKIIKNSKQVKTFLVFTLVPRFSKIGGECL